MSKWNKGLMAAMEDHREFADITMATGFGSPVGLQEANRGVEVFTKDISEAIDGANELKELSSLIEQSDEEAASKIVSIATEGIYNRLGVNKKHLPSMEQYKSNTALESLSSGLKSIWQAIKKAFIRLYEMVKNFFKWLFGNSSKTEDTIELAKELANQIEASLPVVVVDINQPINQEKIEASELSDDIKRVVIATQPGIENKQAEEFTKDMIKMVESGHVEVVNDEPSAVRAIEHSNKVVVEGKKMYIPIKAMIVGHYAKHLEKNKDIKPQEVISSLKKINSNLYSTYQKGKDALKNNLKGSGATSFPDYSEHFMGCFELSKPEGDKFKPTIVEKPCTLKQGVDRIEIPTVRQIEELNQLNKELNDICKRISEDTELQKTMDDIIKKLSSSEDKIPEEQMEQMESFLSSAPFHAVHFPNYLAQLSKAVAQYTKQTTGLYKKKKKK